ncbi:MAG: M48 family metalloprotease [Bdellovibrionota bacterium]
MRFLLATFLAFTLVSCANHKAPNSPATGEKMVKMDPNFEFLPANVETALGEAIHIRILKTYKNLDVSEEFKTYANEITKKVGENSHRSQLKYEVSYLDTKEILAFGLPGGKVLLSKGYLDIVRNESEFANLIANQVAHIANQHLIHDLFKDAEHAKYLEKGEVTERATQQAVFILFELGFTTAFINTADRLAPTYAMHIGYDINGLLNLLERVNESMSKSGKYGKSDLTFNMISHRTSMNKVFVKSLEAKDRSGFPKSEDRFAMMFKKSNPFQ